MATRTFRGTTNSNWNLAGNWLEGAVPIAGDDVIFDASSPSCTQDQAAGANCTTFITTAYTNTITLNYLINVNNGIVTLGSGTTLDGTGQFKLIQSTFSGSVTSGGATINCPVLFNGNTTFTLADDWTIGNTVTLNGTTLIVNGNTLNVNGGLTVTGSIIAGTTNIVMGGTGTITLTATLRNNLTINTAGTITFAASTHLYNTGTLTYTSGTVVTTNSTLNIAASTTLNTDGITWNSITFTGTITITNNSNLTYTGTLQVVGTTVTVTINGNTLYCGGNITFPGTAEIIQGTTNIVYNGTGTWAAINNSTCAIKNNFTINTAGTLTLGNGVQSLGYNTGIFTYSAGTLVFTNSYFTCAGNTTLDWNGVALKNALFQAGTISLLSNFSATGTLTHNQSVTYSGSGIWTCANFSITTAGAIVTLPAGQTYRITNDMTSVGTNATHQGISSYNLLKNLSSYWKFDEGSGTTVSDVVGGKTLTFTTGNTWTEGIINSGITYGTSGKGSFAGIASTTSYTISMWIKPVSGAATYSNLFANTAAGFFYKGDTKKLSVYYLGDHLSTTPLTLSAWTHVCVSVDNGNGTFYVNGVPDGTFTGATSFTPTNMGGDTANQYFRSSMDEVGFWLRPLTQAEVTVLYNTTGLPYSSFFTTLRSNLILNDGATQDNGFLNGTSIDSSGGQTIWTYKGVLSGTINWNTLPTEPKTVGYSF